MAVGQAGLHLSRPSAVLQSVLCGADALIPVQTGAAGSASLTLLGNGSLIYQVRVRGCRRWEGSRPGSGFGLHGSGPRPSLPLHFALPNPAHQVQVVGTGSEVVAMTLETKPQRRNQRTVLCRMAGLQLGGHTVSTSGRARPQGPHPRANNAGLWEARLDEQRCSESFTH